MLPFHLKPEGTLQRRKLQHAGELFATTCVEVFLENLTDTKLKSKTAVMLSQTSLILYHTVCKIQIFSRIYFCNLRLSFVSDEDQRTFWKSSGRNVSQMFSVSEGGLDYNGSVLRCLHLLQQHLYYYSHATIPIFGQSCELEFGIYS